MGHKRIKWTAEKANRLYDYQAENPPLQENFWGFQLGEAVVHLATFFVDNIKACNTLDYGSGMGHIIGFFLGKGVNVSGCDMSSGEVNYVNEVYKDNEYFKGVKLFSSEGLPFRDDSFDLITCTECIEHILDKDMDFVLSELLRILKTGGIILFTTPNDEKMVEAEVLCPECGTVFHRHGHVRTFTEKTLNNIMEEHGFKTVECNVTDFYYIKKYLHSPSIMDLSLRQMLRRVQRKLLDLSDVKYRGTIKSRLYKKYVSLSRNPHLFYVGTKR